MAFSPEFEWQAFTVRPLQELHVFWERKYIDFLWLDMFRNDVSQFRMGVSQISLRRYRISQTQEKVHMSILLQQNRKWSMYVQLVPANWLLNNIYWKSGNQFWLFWIRRYREFFLGVRLTICHGSVEQTQKHDVYIHLFTLVLFC